MRPRRPSPPLLPPILFRLALHRRGLTTRQVARDGRRIERPAQAQT
jgi:hypothetical protein